MESQCGHECPLSAGGVETPAGVSRREWLSYAGAAVAALALAACGGADTTSPTTITQSSLTLSDYPALANVGGIATVTMSGLPLAIVRSGAASFLAFSRICPHQGSTINVVNSGFVCPNHGATFNASGMWIGGQPTSNLTAYPVTYNATAGTITIG